MSIEHNLEKLKRETPPNVTMVAVSKTKTPEEILEAYRAGQRIFGENRVQELLQKYGTLPQDIEWHLIGHLQSNKVRFVVPFVKLIHSVDSLKLLNEINNEAEKINRVVDCLIEIRIAREETKHGLDFEKAEELFRGAGSLKNVAIKGLMGIATNTNNENVIRKEFRSLREFYDRLNSGIAKGTLSILSMGMSNDFKLAIEEGSNMIRVGSLIFGSR